MKDLAIELADRPGALAAMGEALGHGRVVAAAWHRETVA